MTFDPTDKTDEELQNRRDYINSLTMSPSQRAAKVQEFLIKSGTGDLNEWDITCYCAYWLMTNLSKDSHPVYHAIRTILTSIHMFHYHEIDWEMANKQEEKGEETNQVAPSPLPSPIVSIDQNGTKIEGMG